MTDSSNGMGADRHVGARLRATLMSGDRLYPVIVTDISEDGFSAEGAALEGLGDECLLEMTLPPVAEPAWSPKARLGSGVPCRMRAQVRCDAVPAAGGGPFVARLRGRFEAMSDTCRSLLHAWMVRWSAPDHPINRGAAPRVP